jgi:hypothetical protein
MSVRLPLSRSHQARPNTDPLTRLVNRFWTWAVVRDDGLVFDERGFGSYREVPLEGHRLTRIVLWPAQFATPEQGRQLQLIVPEDAEPFIFGRHRHSTNPEVGSEAITCMGYENAQGKVYVWVNDAGDVIVSTRDLDDVIAEQQARDLKD